MTQESLETQAFLDKCPAWARKLGVRTLAQWRFIEAIMPLGKGGRFDELDELKVVATKVLDAWDEMAIAGNYDY